MTKRVYNFNPGPATLPLSILEKAQAELLNYNNTGMSVMEISHRSKEFEAIVSEAENRLKSLLQLNDDYRVLFLQGGATTQFSMIPMNYLKQGTQANYIVTGSFADKACKEAAFIGETHVAASSKDANHSYIPELTSLNLSDNPAYVHITSNNTIYGTQFKEFPEINNVPLIADMSSDLLCKPFDANKFALIYAGAQKNLGPSGVTIVIIRKDLIEASNKDLPSMLRYDIMAENNSLYNTPPSFSIYMVNLMLEWVIEQGGLIAMEKHNDEKASYIYQAIDSSSGFYKGHSQPEFRSTMNVTFTIANSELESKFIAEAAGKGLIGVKGHRSVGGMRTSIYNAMPKEGCLALAEFMAEFQKNNQ
ncbi:3-phosphoserine/phosphohydroxythreonine transaminase [Desulfuribacillus alkaliarsenatis]|uniref:Phosphoserine aminotransferase n=1 Tax=Desulfuribacillus alkaliarsenatis TaxID=766136 RepID=A0A1E5G012_9FIRM|nr:3-phosphoserine/phosphohydroxythreonine transaminase [Desulfuribacillus alkaliarsenatis]OEF96039.1 phosphoserine transaminase [Desulfuribacillus alkaliarsenatis]